MEHTWSVLGSSELNEKMDKLKRKLQVLASKEDDTKEELKQTEHCLPSKKTRKEVKTWVANVERIKYQVQLQEREVQRRQTWCTNSQFGDSVDKLTKEIDELIMEGKFPRGLTLEAYENEGVVLLTKRLIGATFTENKKIIWDCLMDGKDSIIGIYGMGGVGKTTLATHIHNQLREHNIHVIWVTVSQNFKIHKLQDDIAKKVHLDLSKEFDERIRAARLARALMERKNVILILDDVWEHISPDKVGICVGVNGCKMILTTRSLEVCRKMSCQQQIKVQPLSQGEAKDLFMETLGKKISLQPETKDIAESLVHECGGLPLGIITIAGCMRGVDDLHEWRNALKEIKESKHTDDDLEFNDVFRILKHSYDKLRDPKVQQCFLYCALYPEDYSIPRDDLIEYFIDEKLIDGMTSRQSEFDKGHTWLNKLENACLLEGKIDDKDKRVIKYVKMHDLVRDMALRIASVNPIFLVEARAGLRDMPKEEKWTEDIVRASLMGNEISNISSTALPRCPELVTILLCENRYLKTVPDCFFTYMNRLSVLDLSYTSLTDLPPSISNLLSLTALLLKRCELITLPSLANLRSLRRLDLSYTNIKEVPEGMERLINLKYLDLDGCYNLKVIPDGILPKLSQIQYLGSGISKLRGKELASLINLETYKGQVYDIDIDWKTCVRYWEEAGGPKNYAIFVGRNLSEPIDFYSTSTFNKQVTFCTSELHATEDAFAFPTSVQNIRISGCPGVRCLCDVESLREASDLRDFLIDGCSGMRHLFCSFCCSLPFVRSLETLQLWGTPVFDMVGRERSKSSTTLPPGTFSSLRSFVMSNCHNIKRLFPSISILVHLQSLEIIR